MKEREIVRHDYIPDTELTLVKSHLNGSVSNPESDTSERENGKSQRQKPTHSYENINANFSERPTEHTSEHADYSRDSVQTREIAAKLTYDDDSKSNGHTIEQDDANIDKTHALEISMKLEHAKDNQEVCLYNPGYKEMTKDGEDGPKVDKEDTPKADSDKCDDTSSTMSASSSGDSSSKSGATDMNSDVKVPVEDHNNPLENATHTLTNGRIELDAVQHRFELDDITVYEYERDSVLSEANCNEFLMVSNENYRNSILQTQCQ